MQRNIEMCRAGGERCSVQDLYCSATVIPFEQVTQIDITLATGNDALATRCLLFLSRSPSLSPALILHQSPLTPSIQRQVNETEEERKYCRRKSAMEVVGIAYT